MNGKTHKGRFKPKNPEKYRGDPSNIIYRSSWELHLMRYCDQHPDIISWSSEEIVISYVSPIDNRRHRYFPDFFVKKKDKNGKISSVLIEVKPKAQTLPPDKEKGFTKTGKPTKRFLREVETYGINSAKWAAAEKYCLERGWTFQKFTEENLFPERKK